MVKKNYSIIEDIPLVVNLPSASNSLEPAKVLTSNLDPKDWNNLLKYIKSYIDKKYKPNMPFKAFISYAWEDTNTIEGKIANSKLQNYLERLRNDLQAVGISVFLDIGDMHGNMKTRMKENLLNSDFIFVILTPRFKERILNSNTNLHFEYNIILQKIKEKPYALIPLHYSGEFSQAVPNELYDYLIRDCRYKNNYKAMLVDTQRPLGIIPAIFNISNKDQDYKNLIFSWRLKHFNNLPFKSESIFERNILLHKLELLFNEKNKNFIALKAICGLPGMGKKELALKFAHKNLNNYQTIRWIKGKDSQLKESFLSMAQDLGIENTGIDFQDLVGNIYKKLENISWLLIFEDVNELKDIKNFLPKKFKDNQSILIVSKNQDWPYKINIPFFDKKEATHYIKKYISNISINEAEKLSESLGYFPQAIHLALLYIQETKIPIHSFLEIDNEKIIQLLNKYEKTKFKNIDSKTFINEIEKNLDELEKTSQDAYFLLTVCAYFHNKNIPLGLLEKNILKKDKTKFYKALKQLYNFSLIEQNFDQDYININAFLQSIIKYKNKKDKSIEQLTFFLQDLDNTLNLIADEKINNSKVLLKSIKFHQNSIKENLKKINKL